MDAYYVNYLEQLQRKQDELKACLLNLPAGREMEALNWNPGPETNSLTVLAIHVAGAQRHWIGDNITQRQSTRDRDAEFRARDLPLEDLLAVLDDSMRDATAALEPLVLSDLMEARYLARYEKDFPIAYVLNQALAHAALHVGHAELTRQLWEQRYTT